MTSDLTINEFFSFNDQPLVVDGELHFQFSAYANSLTKLISSTGTQTPLTIGINGEWGSGKTTLMKAIQRRLDNLVRSKRADHDLLFINELKRKNCFRPCRTIWFNAWKYSEADHLFTALIQEIIKEMKKDGFFYRMYADLNDPNQPEVKVPEALISALTQVFTLGQVDIDITKFETESRFRTNLAFYDEFQAFFDRLVAWYVSGRRGVQNGYISDEDGALVIFIDDLDRCLPEKSVQVLETIKLFMDKPGVIFVLGADLKMITAAVEAHYKGSGIDGIKSSDYLDKVIQIRFDLPPIDKGDMRNFVEQLPNVDEKLKHSLEIIASGIETNPRKIKTFINHIEIQWDIIVNAGLNKVIKKENLIEWLVLKAACPEFIEFLLKADNNEELVQSLQKMHHYSKQEVRKAELIIDEKTRMVYLGDFLIHDISDLEYKFLLFLYKHKDRVVTREQLVSEVWDASEGVSNSSIDTLVSRIRRKIEPNEDDIIYLQTVRRAGFILNTNQSSDSKIISLPAELEVFKSNMVLKRILSRGNYNFTADSIGYYIHLSTVQPTILK